MRRTGALTDVRGIEVGHAQDEEALTGCTVILCRKGAVAGVDVRGGAPGTRETDLLDPVNLVEKVHAIVLAGGSAFGLDAASGVMHYLAEKKIGFDTGPAKVPIVPAAILYDLGLGRADVWPDTDMGYRAAASASSAAPAEGNAGVGMGASVGKMFGGRFSMKAGVGTAGIDIAKGVIVGALVGVNAWGDVVDPQTGQVVAGLRAGTGHGRRVGKKAFFADTLRMMKSMDRQPSPGSARRTSTVIGVVATNAKLTKAQATKMAQMGHDGLARAISPIHTPVDGDTVFALATGAIDGGNLMLAGSLAAEVTADAVLRAVREATGAAGIPAVRDLPR